MFEGKVCTSCLLDESDPSISFDEKGVCNYCQTWRDHKEWYGYVENGLEVWENEKLPLILASGVGKKYDALVGVSGGIDSSYLAYRLSKYPNLRVLLVHVSGVFDTEVSKRNIKRIVDNTGYDIIYPTVDLADYVSIQKAYLESSVLDADVPADYLIEAYTRMLARKNKIKYVLSGGNYMADAFMPYTWTMRYKLDYANLEDIQSQFGEGHKIKSFPKFGLLDELITRRFYHLQYETPLNFMGYSRFTALKELKDAWGYEAYGDKHDENIFTRFYQKFILPYKFNIDKRKANYSNYVRCGVWTRDQALQEIAKPFYDPAQFASDLKEILRVLNWTEHYFYRVMAKPPVAHDKFATSDWIYNMENKAVELAHRFGF